MNKKRSYEDSVHIAGRVWIIVAVGAMIMVPVLISTVYGAWPDFGTFLKGLLGVAPVFWTVGIVEVFTYAPMMGNAGSYLAFVTGNLANLKVPVALNSMENMGVEPGTEEGEVISTIAIAVSSLVTTVIIALGVFLLAQIRPILESPVLAPAFANILPALFGALGVVYVAKNWKIAITPLVVMLVLFILIPGLSSMVGIMVPVGVLITLGSARLLYKKNLL